MDWFELLIRTVVTIVIAAVIGAVVWGTIAIFSAARSPIIELVKTDWTCTKSRRVPTTYYVKSGDILVPVTSHSSECIQYTAN